LIFSDPDFIVFLPAVFFLYYGLGALRGLRTWHLALTLGGFFLLGDLIYLLLSKDPRSLWDPLGALVYHLAARPLWLEEPPAFRPLWEYLAGLLVSGAGLWLGRSKHTWISSDAGQAKIAFASMAGILGMGAAVLGMWWAGALDAFNAAFTHAGHLLYLVILGMSLGASLVEEGRTLGRHLALFLVSALFYHSWAAWMPGAYKHLLLLILFTIVLDYYLALWIDRAEERSARRLLVVVSLVSNLGILALFKYFDFFLGNQLFLLVLVGALLLDRLVRQVGAGLSLTVQRALRLLVWSAALVFYAGLDGGQLFAIDPVKLILPAGISFHTFQSLSYTIDVYQRQIKPTRSVLEFATFVLLFPQLVAGPIVRAHEFMPQMGLERRFSASREAEGFWRICIGLFKKLALADVLATALVDRVFERPELFSSVEVLFGVYGYALQIYLDFSAYSDIAIGAAMLLGFEFPENFRTPYRSADLQEFWRRWHITLSSWLRDYLYIALGGSRGGPSATYRNLALTMLLGGLWHGANWTFIVWGALHGGGLAVTRVWQRMAAEEPDKFKRALWPVLWVASLGLALHTGVGGTLLVWLAGRWQVDIAWLHLIFAWLYLTPLWALLTAKFAAEAKQLAAPKAPPVLGAWLGRARLLLMNMTWLLWAVLLVGPDLLSYWTIGLVALLWLASAAFAELASAPVDGAGLATLARSWWRRAAATVLTFQYVCLAWIFFRAVSFDNARQVLSQMGVFSTDAVNLSGLFLVALLVGFAAHLFPENTYRWLRERFVSLPAWAKALFFVALALSIKRLASPGVVPFIYFQF
jgi:D-alanyl-lipoteichoic acid acyltransferase DltB (MBOAT superfamily)